MLNQLRERIRKALFVEQLGQINGPRMTATEVLQRAAEIAASLGRLRPLQSELMAPLVSRARSILARRGEIEDFPLYHQFVALDYRSPQARFQAQLDVQNTLMWLDSVRNLGPEGLAAIDPQATARWLGTSLGVPVELMREAPATEVAGAPAPGLAAFAASVDPTAGYSGYHCGSRARHISSPAHCTVRAADEPRRNRMELVRSAASGRCRDSSNAWRSGAGKRGGTLLPGPVSASSNTSGAFLPSNARSAPARRRRCCAILKANARWLRI